MKKLFLIVLFIVGSLTVVTAQDSIVFNVHNLPESMEVCINKVIVIYAEDNCEQWSWEINNVPQTMENPLVIDSQIEQTICVEYYGCNVNVYWFNIHFNEPWSAPSFTETIWKRHGENITINPASFGIYGDSFLWSNGETNPIIDISEPGTYILQMSYLCGDYEYTFIVQDNVEIELATCDLVTNLNMVTWQTTPAQAQYIDHVIVKRDGLNVGTANYSEGSFLDDIGSDLAQRTYTLTAVATDGTECPIVSYPKETIHMAYLTGVNNTIEVNWNTPTGYDLLGYNICEWTPNGKDGDLRVIDFVGASVTSYTCQASQFTSGYVIIQGVEASKPESRLLSNRSSETVDVGEYGMEGFKVYPNPASGAFTVEGMGYLTVLNLLGQEILAQEVEGKTTLELPKGIYLMRLGSANRKIVVE